VRWAVLNVAAMLKKYSALQERLAAAMDRGAPIGELLRMIEEEVSKDAPAVPASPVGAAAPDSS
jgi:hypothetical protein